MTTVKEMLQDGWKRRVINGIRVLQNDESGIIVNDSKREFIDPLDMLNIVDSLGKPDKIHTENGTIISLEYQQIAHDFQTAKKRNQVTFLQALR